MPMPASSSGAVPIGRFGNRLRMILPCTTAIRPPSLKLQTETPTAAPSTVLLAITAPSNENSEYSATSRTPETLLPVIWMLDAELPRTGIIAIADAVAAHDDIAGAKRVDGVAVLPGAAGAGLDVLDTVVGDLRAVIADRRAQDFDAVVVGALNRVARHQQA